MNRTDRLVAYTHLYAAHSHVRSALNVYIATTTPYPLFDTDENHAACLQALNIIERLEATFRPEPEEAPDVSKPQPL